MFVEQLNDLMLKELAYEILKLKAHKNPNDAIIIGDITSCTKINGYVKFDVEYYIQNRLSTLHIEASDYVIQVNHVKSNDTLTLFQNYMKHYNENYANALNNQNLQNLNL